MKKVFQTHFVFLLILVAITAQATPTKTKVYVYADEGTSQDSVSQVIQLVHKQLGATFSAKAIMASEVKTANWIKDAALFVIPGGRDIPYTQALNGQGNNIIKKYVEQGGSYLGICAGAYYASSSIAFETGTRLEVNGERELGFFAGKSIGAHLAPYDYQSLSGSRAAYIFGTVPYGISLRVYYNGGGYFENADEMKESVKVAARYQQSGEAAIVFINHLKGKVALSGVHFETESNHMLDQDPYSKPLKQPLEESANKRALLNTEIFKFLGLYAGEAG